MTSEQPPTEYFAGIDFNPSFYQDTGTTAGISETTANLLYLRKTVADTATAVETFNTGIKTNTIDNVLTTDTSNILIDSIGSINIGTSAARGISYPIIIGNATGTITRFGTATLQMSTLGTPTATLQAINTSGISVITPGSAFNFLSNHTTALSIGSNPLRTGNVLIANTQTTGTGNIVLGSNVITGIGTQDIICNRAITLNYLSTLQTSHSQLGYYQTYVGTQTTMPAVQTQTTFVQTSTSLPSGIYLINYGLTSLLTLSTTGACIVEEQAFGVSTVTGTVYSLGCSQTIREDIERPPGSQYNASYTCVEKLTVSSFLYLTGSFKFSSNCSLKITGTMSVTRIG